MRTVLIADDEMRVCHLIRSMIQWEALGLRLVDTASDGIEEYDKIVRHQPDIVITDIRMPGMEGLAVIEKAQRLPFPVSFIVISGYQQFEYAHTALKYGVEDYLLKPIKRAEINAILSRIVGDRERQDSRDRQIRSMEESARRTRWMLQQQTLELCVRGDVPPEEKQRRLEAFHPEFLEGDACPVVLAVDQDSLEHDRAPAIAKAVEKQCQQLLGRQHPHLLLGRIETRVVAVFSLADACGGTPPALLQPVFQRLQDYVCAFQGCHLTLFTGSIHTGAEGLAAEIHRVYHSADGRVLWGVDRVYAAARLYESCSPEPQNGWSGRLQAIGSLVRGNDGALLAREIREYLEELREVCRKDFLAYFDGVEGLIRCFCDTLEQLSPSGSRERRQQLLTRVRQLPGHALIAGYLSTALPAQAEAFHSRHRAAETKPVRVVKQYINRHYARNISLADMAELADLSPVYLSVLFKRETGDNFNAYLTRVRMGEAQRMLRETNETVNCIAQQCGYADPKYFSQVFKKSVGMNPAMFRKFYC